MFDATLILNERDAARARTLLARAQDASSGDAVLRAAAQGLPPSVITAHQNATKALATDLAKVVKDYDELKKGNTPETFKKNVDPGLALILARISKGLSQAQLAEMLGLKEQQIQRYEAERYRSISLSNYRKIAANLTVELVATLKSETPIWATAPVGFDARSSEQLPKLAAHIKKHEWFALPARSEEQSQAIFDYLSRADRVFVSPVLLRTGLHPNDVGEDLMLAAWRARVLELAESEIDRGVSAFDPLDISWLGQLAQLSARKRGPLEAVSLLRNKGIIVLVEPQISGLRLDGAAMLLRSHPIIALTLRFDRVDYFWFTLFHELAHIFLHHRVGLSAGFFDDVEMDADDRVEDEANEFASAALVPPELWRVSTARIAKETGPIEDFARQIGIHPAIVFGRLRKDRGDYKLFAKEVGAGEVRELFNSN